MSGQVTYGDKNMKTQTYRIPNVPKIVKDLTNVQFMKYRVASQKGRVTKLENEVHSLQHLVKDDLLSLTTAVTSYKGNSYPSYPEAVAEIDRKYRGVADWGVVQTGNIIDLRAAFIIGDGITVSAKEEGAELELEWTERFLKYNDLDHEVAQEFAKETEIEGKIALKLALEEDKDTKKKEDAFMISVRFISWTDKNYEIITNPQDYLDYQKLKWKATGQTKGGTLGAKEFVYKKFGGRISKPNEAAPKIMKCLTQIEGLDKAERDWRQINHIFAAPVLYAKCDAKTGGQKEVNLALAALADKNFKINKILAGTFDLSFLPLDIKGIESIEREIINAIKMVSGCTGIPVSFLGFVDLMSNRATAESLIDMINAGTTKERQTWIGAYEETIRKAMVMYNEGSGKMQLSKEKQLDPDKIKVDIPIITQQHYDRLEKIFVPLYMAGKLSDETFYAMVPGLDVKVEMERKAEKEKSEIEQIKTENEGLRSDKLEENIFGKEEG